MQVWNRGWTVRLGAVALLALGGGCASQDRGEAERPEARVSPAPEGSAAAERGPKGEGEAPTEAEANAPKAEPRAPVGTVEAEIAPRQGVGTAAADKFKAWGVVHAFLGSQVTLGHVISATEGIALTKDNHVGVTTDAGASWGFQRHTNGTVVAVAGAPGGPYVAVGKNGYMAMSKDGRSWSDLPRFTNDELVSVTVGEAGVVAVGKTGSYVRYDKAGNVGVAGMLPDKFKAKTVITAGGKAIAFAGKNGYATTNGSAWMKLDELPALPDGKTAATSKGLCAKGRVGKGTGIVCEVKGLAHGLSKGVAVVEAAKHVAFTNDNGGNWVMATLPFKGLKAVIGSPSGPYYALGAKGGLAVTRDGAAWAERPLNTTKTLNAGLVDGATILIVGDGGTIVRSADGGESFAVLPAPANGSFKAIFKVGGRYVIPNGKSGIESADGGVTWTEVADPTELASLALVGKPGDCDGLPGRSEVCKLTRTVTTPMGLPNVASFSFEGDIGLAVGAAGLVAFTTDGGASWKARSGFELRGLSGFDTRGERIVAIGGGKVVVSVDGGKAFKEAQLPKKAGKIVDTFIASDGSVYAAGGGGTILKAQGNLDLWLQLDTGPKNKTAFIGLHEVGGVLYAAGARGELYRSDNEGSTWWPVATGTPSPIQRMTGEGNTVLAVTYESRNGGNLLLRSNDGGRHFFVQREISHQGRVEEFTLAEGTLRYRDRVSSDFGATWTQSQAAYWPGAVDVADGSGLRLVHYGSYRSKDRVFLVGQGKDDWTLIDSFYGQDARFFCEKTSGCWMVAGGQVYRPI